MRLGSTRAANLPIPFGCDPLVRLRRLVCQLMFPTALCASSERSLWLSLAAGKTLGIPRKGLDSQRPRQEYV